MPTLRLSPRTASVVRGVGRTLIGGGIVVLLFVAFQLWGTGLAHSREQSRLEDRFSERLEAVRDLERHDDGATPPSDGRPDTGSSNTGSSNTGSSNTVPPELVDALAPAHGDPVARIRIPTIGVDEIVVHGVDVADLRRGPGHFPDSPMPGQSGNAAIAGHRTTYGQPFHDLDRLAPGDEIAIDTLQGSFTYRVMAHEDDDGAAQGYVIVPETAVEVLDDVGDDRVTLVACHPKFSSRQRIIVTAELVDEPAATLPVRDRDDVPRPETDSDAEEIAAPVDFGEGLGGESDALVPAVAWGALFLAALAATIVAGLRWRRWPAWLLGTPLTAVPLFVAFSHLDRYLPAY